jgi:hypothetical protein
MIHLTLRDIEMVLIDLLEKRGASLELSRIGQGYRPGLEELRRQIAAVPESFKGKPLSDQLAEADQLHDGFGLCIWSYGQAMEAMPGLPSDLKASIARVLERLVPERGALRAAYLDEAADARRHRGELAELEADLRKFPIPGERTLYDMAEGFVAQGERIGELLSQRADAAQAAQQDLRQLRSRAMGFMIRMREAISDEILIRPELPRDLDTLIFSYLDEVSAMRATAGARAAAAMEPKANEPEPPPTEPTA